MQQANQTDYHELDDPEFLAERARVRDLLEQTPEDAEDHAELAEVFEGMNDEFIRRARHAWSKAMPRIPLSPGATSEMNDTPLELVARATHEPLPVRGTIKREWDEIPLNLPVNPADYPILADCAGCEEAIRKENQLLGEWEHK